MEDGVLHRDANQTPVEIPEPTGTPGENAEDAW